MYTKTSPKHPKPSSSETIEVPQFKYLFMILPYSTLYIICKIPCVPCSQHRRRAIAARSLRVAPAQHALSIDLAQGH